MSRMTIVSAAVLLFLVMDPLGNIPFFIAALRNVESTRQTRVVLRELLIALAILIAFLFLGRNLLNVLGISEPALTLSGGVILFLISLRMIFPTPESSMREETHGAPFVVPLAIPYVAGPSALATLLVITSREPDRLLEWLAALIGAWAVSSVILLTAGRLSRWLGQKGVIALERLMGMILVAIAIQMLLTGIKAALEPR